MGRRAAHSEEEGSLDSLLDTMTNVVGILIILMAMTQIGVGDAVQRILRETDAPLAEVSDEAVISKQSERDELEKTLKAVRFQWEELAREVNGNQASLKKIMEIVEELRAELRDPLADNVSRDELGSIIDGRQSEVEELNAKFLTASAELEKLKAQLAKTPERPEIQPKIVTLPNPRPAPTGHDAIVFFCRDGQIYPVDEDYLQRVADSGVERAHPSTNAKGQVDCKAIVDFFATRSLGDKNFKLKAEVHNFTPYLVLQRRADAGESARRIQDFDSDYQRILRQAIGRRKYIRFRVWPDSFETYVAARAIADRMDIAAGWEPQTRSDEWKIRLAGNIQCIGKPPHKIPEPATAEEGPPDSENPRPEEDPILRRDRPAPVDEID